ECRQGRRKRHRRHFEGNYAVSRT
ncbi:MAG: hypothetical protein AVDCRST_MAG76-2758, partial [uncultured Acidimicrobiales bacterium]